MSTRVPDLTQVPRGEPDEWWIYTHVDATGRVLYVGCTNSPRGRQSHHRRRASWWPEVVTVAAIGPFKVRTAALDAETRLIAELDPPNNVMHTEREWAVYERAWEKRRAQAAERVSS